MEGTPTQVTPDQLYMDAQTQRFMSRCKTKGVSWAIFSDKYGVWFPNEKHEFYEKPPSTVTPQEFETLTASFDSRLRDYSEIWFYFNPRRFHSFYRRVLRETKLRRRVKPFSHLKEIG